MVAPFETQRRNGPIFLIVSKLVSVNTDCCCSREATSNVCHSPLLAANAARCCLASDRADLCADCVRYENHALGVSNVDMCGASRSGQTTRENNMVKDGVLGNGLSPTIPTEYEVGRGMTQLVLVSPACVQVSEPRHIYRNKAECQPHLLDVTHLIPSEISQGSVEIIPFRVSRCV